MNDVNQVAGLGWLRLAGYATDMSTVYLNGKFVAQAETGVQRVARQLVLALDAQLESAAQTSAAGSGTEWVLLLPPGCATLSLKRIAQRHIGTAGHPLHLWEQASLPQAARRGLLVNLAGSAPYLAQRQAVFIHDAAVFDHPDAYTYAFRTWYRQLFRRLASTSEHLMTTSEFSRQRLALHLGLSPERFSVIHSGCDHFDRVEADESVLDRLGLRGTRFVLAVGSSNATKNLASLVGAYARVPRSAGLRLVIVGGRNARVFAAGEPRGDPAGVVRTGRLGDEPLKALYAAATALVFPSIYEGFGLPPLEAMRCGCPVLAARAASIPEVCGDAALYFDPKHPDSLTDALTRIATDVELMAPFRLAGTKRAATFRWAASARSLLDGLRSSQVRGGLD